MNFPSGSGGLARATPTSDLRHVAAVTAHRLAALLAGLSGFRTREFVSRALLVSSPATLGRDCSLTLVAHPGEASAVCCDAPRPRDSLSRLRRARPPRPTARRLPCPGR